MAENKTKPTVISVEAFLDGVMPDARREDGRALCALMQRISGYPPVLWGPSIIGFGQYRYRTEAGREGEICRVGFSPRKPATVLYIHSSSPKYAELMTRLGKVSTGKSCIYVKRLSDIDLAVLEEMVRASLEHLEQTHPTT
jgi:hypothetical protein